MVRTEFGIIEDFDEKQNYTGYTPEKYHCVAIDDISISMIGGMHSLA